MFFVNLHRLIFKLQITTLHLGDTKPLVCNTCINRLRDSADFKQQVMASLDTLETMVKINSESITHNMFYFTHDFRVHFLWSHFYS